MSFAQARGEAETLRTPLKNATQVVSRRDTTLELIREPLGPLITFEWDASVLRIFGKKRVSDFLQLLRSSILPLKDCAVLANLVKGSMKEFIGLIPPHWGT